MTAPDDLAEAEREAREDHKPDCWYSHDPHDENACVGDCDMRCETDGMAWPCSTATLLAEYDLRGQVVERARVIAEFAFTEDRRQMGHFILSGDESVIRPAAADGPASAALAGTTTPTANVRIPCDRDGHGWHDVDEADAVRIVIALSCELVEVACTDDPRDAHDIVPCPLRALEWAGDGEMYREHCDARMEGAQVIRDNPETGWEPVPWTERAPRWDGAEATRG